MQEERYRVGLEKRPGSGLLGWLMPAASATSDSGGSGGGDKHSITDLWVEFLLAEAKASGAGDAADGAATVASEGADSDTDVDVDVVLDDGLEDGGGGLGAGGGAGAKK